MKDLSLTVIFIVVAVVLLLMLFGAFSKKDGFGQDCSGYSCQSTIDNSTKFKCCKDCDNCRNPASCKAGCECKFGKDCDCLDGNRCSNQIAESFDIQGCCANCEESCGATNRAKCKQGCYCVYGQNCPSNGGCSGYACSGIWQDGSDENDCCTNCYMCYNRRAEVIGPNGNVIDCQAVGGNPAYKCPTPDSCALGCKCEYNTDCGTGDNSQCIDKMVRDSTFEDCEETCKEQHESDKYHYGCVLSDSDLDECLNKCCSAGKSWDPDCY